LRVFVVDDHELVRMGLRNLLATVPDVNVVGEAGSIEMAMSQLRTLQPDIVLLDARLPDGDGASACVAIRQALPNTRVIILTGFADDVIPAIVAGASGYVLKTSNVTELIDALHAVSRGDSYLSPAVTKRVLERVRTSDDDKTAERALGQLDAQERRILSMIAEGRTNAEIASVLNLPPYRVKRQVSDILTRLGARRRTEAAAIIARQPDSPY
jgi:two-component system, NarL family, response regulator DevR